jgi:hypothetical protein
MFTSFYGYSREPLRRDAQSFFERGAESEQREIFPFLNHWVHNTSKSS